jgi:hypothetical protein
MLPSATVALQEFVLKVVLVPVKNPLIPDPDEGRVWNKFLKSRYRRRSDAGDIKHYF